ncbi:MAG TPA: LA2681 family HEPN domain-containing protein [Thermoanaerobaculia bacterium]|nr:LA2681 family HEPN domain-containing protein [Thermoanaerobaculia bacterium]
MSFEINSPETRSHAHQKATELEHENPRGALDYVTGLTATDSWRWALLELRGIIGIDAGFDLKEIEEVGRGIGLLKSAFPDHPHPMTAYNIANGENARWELVLGAEGIVAAIERERKSLHAARRAWEQIGRDSAVEPDLRAQALVNAGNSYDNLGRGHEGIRLYDEALEVVPDFAMAHGNRGKALAITLPFAFEHTHAVLAEAIAAFDAALDSPDDVVRVGGPSALASFQQARDQLPDEVPEHRHEPEVWNDPYLSWCRQHGLFLHVSPTCLTETSPLLDPLMFERLVGGLEDGSLERGDALFDGLNAIKREFTTARYLTWLALDPQSTVAEQTGEVDHRTRLVDTLNYGRWGLRTGIAVQSFAATTNLLDKVATFTHAYFETGHKPNEVFFRDFWQAPSSKSMDSKLAAVITPPRWNPGLAALCDLANDLRDDTPLAAFVALRHAATHRLVVAHEFKAPESTGWLERVEWSAFKAASLDQLQLARAAIIYLVRAVDTEEHAKSQQYDDGALAPLSTAYVDADLSQLD